MVRLLLQFDTADRCSSHAISMASFLCHLSGFFPDYFTDTTMKQATEKTDYSDPELVTLSLAGDRDAFERIVTRYQTLLCSLAYGATGSLGQSEDLAQETFVTAWKQLADLREPEKLRSWLCRISRNLTYDAMLKQGREPIHKAESLDEIEESAASITLPSECIIGREEEAILWRLIERIPESYREPLVLFYREHQSIEHVASALDLSEDAVKQRLSRGRKILHSEVLAFLGGALKRTTPGKAFTVGVLATLPAFVISARAAEMGAATAKGGVTAKAVAASGLSSVLLAPALGFAGNYFGYRVGMAGAQSDDERDYIRRFYRRLMALILVFWAGYALLMIWAKQFVMERHLVYSSLVIGLVLPFTIVLFASGIFRLRAPGKFQAKIRGKGVSLNAARPAWEYRSKFVLFGLPFIHVRVSGGLAVPIVPVKAWIASGDFALGLLFASGNLAIAPVSIGASAFGLLSFGGCAVGLISLGGLSLGFWSFGALSFGWHVFGACAIAWNAANGGLAIAHHFAVGSIAYALEANNYAAREYFQQDLLFHHPRRLMVYLAWLNLLWVIPMLARWRILAGIRRQRDGY
jgi:RNA polymerase sigma factor (sigma-70 family)